MNNDLIIINNQFLEIKEFKGKRVVTFKDIDTLHERVEGTAKRNFSENKKRFIEKIDYFIAKPSDFEKYEFRTLEIPNRGLILLTESGYLMLTKSLNDDLAWEVQRELVNNYFRGKQFKKLSAIEQLKLQYEVLDQHEDRLLNLENNMTIDYGQQQELQNLAKSKAIEVMGGKESPVYQEKSTRTKVFSGIWKDYKDYFQISSYRNTPRKNFNKATEYIRSWQPQGKLLREIEEVNMQISMA